MESLFGYGYKIKKLKLNGMYGMILLDDERIFMWGESLNNIKMIPQELKFNKRVDNISCGWSHTLI